MADKTPLVLDVDGTFLRTDMLYENFWAGLGQAPDETLRACAKHYRRPEVLKAELARLVHMRPDLMPVSPGIQKLIEEAHADGREVILASASDQRWVRTLAAYHGLSTRFFASDGETNLKGEAKAAALVEAFGEGGFDYAGDSTADRAVWRHARRCIVVNQPATARRLRASGESVIEVDERVRRRDIITALRPHQWVKNVLLFLPMVAAHRFDMPTFIAVVLGIVSFSLAASAIYVVNDLLDLEADRLHVKKKFRPFASGAVPIPIGMIVGAICAGVSLGVAAALNFAFLGIVLCYMTLSLSYSLKLKRMRWIDIAVLATLYSVRVIAGSLAIEGYISSYLLGFIFPAFIMLGCVKRLTEVTLATTEARVPGRAYAKSDRGDLLNVASVGVVFALLAYFGYTFTPQAVWLYPDRWLLWVSVLPIAWWLVRMLHLGYLGKQDHDPIVFAMRDKRGIGIMAFALALIFQAAGLWSEWLGQLF